MSTARKHRRAKARAEAEKDARALTAEVVDGAVAAAPSVGVKAEGSLVRIGGNVISLHRGSVALADTRGPEREQLTPQPSIPWSQGNNSVQYAELTFDRLISIIKTAEQGLTTDWIDLTRRMLRTDSHLASVWETRVAPIAAARWDLEPGAARHPDRQLHADRLADACHEALEQVPDLSHVLLCLLEAIGNGHGIAEILWTRGELLGLPAYVPYAIVPVHPRRFSYDLYYRIGLWDLGRAAAEMRRLGHDVEVGYGRAVVLLPPGKYVVHQPAVIHDWPTTRGLFFSVARQWWVKQQVTKYWLQGAETGANPRTVGTVQQEAVGDNVVSDLRSALENLAADGVAIARKGTTIEWREGVGESGARVWHELYDAMDEAMTKRVLGSTLNVSIGETGGAYAAADSQAATTILPRQQIDADQLWTTLTRDLFRYIRDYNPHLFPPDTPLPRGRTVMQEEAVPVDELVVRARACSVDELRASRKLPAWGGARGEAPANLDPLPPASTGSDGTTAQEAAKEARPFSSRLPPWERARRLSGTTRTPT